MARRASDQPLTCKYWAVVRAPRPVTSDMSRAGRGSPPVASAPVARCGGCCCRGCCQSGLADSHPARTVLQGPILSEVIALVCAGIVWPVGSRLDAGRRRRAARKFTQRFVTGSRPNPAEVQPARRPEQVPLSDLIAKSGVGLSAGALAGGLGSLNEAIAKSGVGLSAGALAGGLGSLNEAIAKSGVGLSAGALAGGLGSLNEAIAKSGVGLSAGALAGGLGSLNEAIAKSGVGLSAGALAGGLGSLNEAIAKSGVGLSASILIDQISTALDGISESLLTPPSQVVTPPRLWTPRRRSKDVTFTESQKTWLSVVAFYILVALIQHLASLAAAEHPVFDIEKFVNHHVQALSIAMGFYAIKTATRGEGGD
ncbi:hypothetical protein CLV70_1381 [Pseudosporangium ferrugineum]|uniref:Uncharacterized protein n=1 Tax=Pseudosporangium ferrugineum TaxID=439699 RepID=A0A2T0RD69_9ACTN|nr:hypothetical protein CLV70_1381 [Pseudosporangium ferrugineum]